MNHLNFLLFLFMNNLKFDLNQIKFYKKKFDFRTLLNVLIDC